MLRTIRHWFAARRLRRQIRAAPEFALGELPEGTYGRVTGTILAHEGRVLSAPLSGRPCVYFAVEILEQQANMTHLRAEEQDGLAFLLEQDGARAVIDPAHAVISARYDHFARVRGLFEITPAQRALLARHGMQDHAWFWTTYLEFREAVLSLEEVVTTVGEGIREGDPDAKHVRGYREAGPTRLRMTGSARAPLVISDDPESV